jgi:hypothetical protein
MQERGREHEKKFLGFPIAGVLGHYTFLMNIYLTSLLCGIILWKFVMINGAKYLGEEHIM